MSDIHFQPVVPASAIKGTKVFTFGFTASLKVTGLQSLVNRWVKTFMTPVGSDPLHPEFGTEFGNLIGANIAGHASALLDVVAIAVDEVNEQVQEQDRKGFRAPDESLDDAQLTRFVPSESGDGFDVWVEITNKEGTTLQVRLAELATR